MKKFTKNSSYKVIRITDVPDLPLTFDTYYGCEKRNFDVITIKDDKHINDLILNNPNVDAIVVQFEGNRPNLDNLNLLPLYWQRKIIEFDVNENYGIALALKVNNDILSGNTNPLISFVTPLYKTNIKYFEKAYESLCSQSVNDWEWVLVDDSPEPLADIVSFINKQCDIRIKYFRIGPTNGNIGLSKWRGNCMSTGKWLFELDHDDVLMPWCIETMIEAMKAYPNNKFIYSDNATIDENGNYTECAYGDYFGLGYGYSYECRTPDGNIIRTDSAGPTNNATIRHIVGVPNHFRCWERSLYFSIGGHNQSMRIADDYELLLRTFFKTRFTHIKACCYAQRFDGNNSQYEETPDTDNQGNINDIQRRVRLASIYYDVKIHERLEEYGLYDSLWIENDPYETAGKYEEVHPAMTCDDEYIPEWTYA